MTPSTIDLKRIPRWRYIVALGETRLPWWFQTEPSKGFQHVFLRGQIRSPQGWLHVSQWVWVPSGRVRDAVKAWTCLNGVRDATYELKNSEVPE